MADAVDTGSRMGMSSKLDPDPWDKVPVPRHKKWQGRYSLFVGLFWLCIGVMDIVGGYWWGPLWIIGSFYWFWRGFKMMGMSLHNWFKKEK